MFCNYSCCSICCTAHTIIFVAEWFAFIGRQAGLTLPGSPYAIMFRPNPAESSGMKPMNVTSYSCGDISMRCSCGDCPSSPVCTNTSPSATHKSGSCSVRIGSLKVRAYCTVVPNIGSCFDLYVHSNSNSFWH